jgi:hypothetical protein
MPDGRRKAEMSEAVNLKERVWSGVRAVVDVAAVNNVEDMDDAGGFVDAVHDPVGATPGSVAAGQRAEQGLADAVRIDRKRGIAEFQDGRGDGLGQPRGDGAPGCGLEADVIPLPRWDGHLPGGAAPGQVLAHRRQVRAGLTSAERGQALGDTGG